MTDLEITPAQLDERRKRGDALQIVDVRNPWEHDIAAIEGDTLIPLHMLAARFQDIDKGRTVIVYCHHGSRSFLAAQALRQAGFDAWSLQGGIERWAREIDRSMRRY
ncbi:MAG TPA: rhodanese-like domain-containing protein [Thermoanaerobaculia bacterium]|nr:rhodanese-like domain-containing protein [Thermoanaerobaculia bacterium]